MCGLTLFSMLIFAIKMSQNVDGIFNFPIDEPVEPIDTVIFEEETFSKAIQLAIDSARRQEGLEKNLISYNVYVTNGSISHAQLLETFPNIKARTEDALAKKILKASRFLNAECKLGNRNKCVNYISSIPLPSSDLVNECLKNVQNSGVYLAFRRLLPANYKDGFYEIARPPNTPKARELSKMISNNSIEGNKKEEKKNLIFLAWTQFVEHDLSYPAVTTMSDGTPIECCNSEFYKLSPRHIHPSCAQLVGTPSTQYSRISCLNYVRSALAVHPNCEFGPAQQLNQATGILDLSQLYGYTSERTSQLRTFSEGRLKTLIDDLLPLAENNLEFCAFGTDSNKPCFMAGDNRVNSNPFMNFIYTIFLRMHNNLADQLKLTNPSWSDEDLFSAARKLNIKIYRNIIYNEWLPKVIGIALARVISEDEGDVPDKDKGISNEFATAAIRFYYSMMPNSLQSPSIMSEVALRDNDIDSSSVTSEPMNLFFLRDEFYKSDYLLNSNKLEMALEAMLEQRALKFDFYYAESVKNHFLRTELNLRQNISLDVLAWDIQRGRDHGLGNYVKYLEVCAMRKFNSWQDLQDVINENNIQTLKKAYKDIEYIDLIVGGLSEKPFEGSMLGITFTCILGEQFSKLRRLEKLQLSNKMNLDDSFTRKLVENFTGTKLICSTTSLTAVPENIFTISSNTNQLKTCANF